MYEPHGAGVTGDWKPPDMAQGLTPPQTLQRFHLRTWLGAISTCFISIETGVQIQAPTSKAWQEQSGPTLIPEHWRWREARWASRVSELTRLCLRK